MNIYQPSDDSYLLAKAIKNFFKNRSKEKPKNKKTNKNIKKQLKILDMGSGSGIQAKICRKLGFKNILTTDINPNAVNNLKKQKFKSIKTNLFSNIKKNKKNKFDIIIFNPPYLPENKYDNEKDTTGGKKGYETIIKFLKQAKPYLTKNSVILLLISSFSKSNIIKKQAKTLGYNLKLLEKKTIFFEKLFVYELKQQNELLK
jgi:release factor glutamine methyltransferase